MMNVQDILFFTYLTGYNIKEIFQANQSASAEIALEIYLRNKHNAGLIITDSQLTSIRKVSTERYEEMRFQGIDFIVYGSGNYPAALKAISSSPPILYKKGTLKKGPNVAIVGTRDASAYAAETVRKIVQIFSDYHYGLVSGLAYGIDKLVHEYSLNAGAYTLAVLPNALDHVYPKEHFHLANEIIQSGGCLISEIPFGINLGKKGFVQRNRLQSGLSSIVVPLEMGVNSGTMHTVQFAIQQKKTLLVIRPGKLKRDLAQYQGIGYLINNAYEKLHIIEDAFTKKDFADFVKNGQPVVMYNAEVTDELELHNKKKEVLSEFCNTIKAKVEYLWDEIHNVNAPGLNDTIKVDVPFFDDKMEEMKMKFQQVIFNFIFQFPILNRKELEKIVKRDLKKLNAAILKLKKKNPQDAQADI